MLNLTPYRKHNNEAAMYNPFRELEDFERSIFAPDTLASFRTDIEDEGDKLVLSADLPGFDKKDIPTMRSRKRRQVTCAASVPMAATAAVSILTASTPIRSAPPMTMAS